MPAGWEHGDSSDSTNPHSKAETMTFKTSVICALALSALAVTAVQAQTTRAAVKAEAAAASKPMGELIVPNQDKGAKPMASTTTRAAVKADASAARAAGTVSNGELGTSPQGKKPPMRTTSNKTRAEVKAEAAAANKAGGLSRGEASVPGQDKGGVKP